MSASKAGTAIQGQSITAEAALARVPGPKGERFAEIFKHGSLSVEIFAPRGVDNQQPHARDEVYVVVHGSGRFVFGAERVTFGPGDFLFVPAGVTHRFEDFTEDFVVWVLFYGPEGGENFSAQTRNGG
jgi:mannose-6-phosphate isomerase-like protein (cupin superfamily)